jgi:antirestriction protein ArdC
MANATVAKHVNHYQTITDSIVKALEQGVKPWGRPWTTQGGAEILDAGLPFNAFSGRNYRGLNVPLLWAIAGSNGYSRHAWLSFKQSQDLGGNVRKGERATLVFYFRFIEKEERTPAGDFEAVRIPLIRAYPVFKVDQCEGVRLPQRARPIPTESGGTLGPLGPVVDRPGLSGGVRYVGDAAFYSPSIDTVTVPAVERFKSPAAFLATLLHECGHATGHTSRLNRDFSGRFGSEAYAFEELVAELASAFSQAVLGIRADIELHATYIESWQRVLKQDRHAFVKACSLAQAATDLMVGQHEQPDAADSNAVRLKAAA